MSNKHTTLEQLEKLAVRTKSELDLLNEQIEGIEDAEYSIVKQSSAENGYLATYQLAKDGVVFGEKINIPKDFLVKSASIKTVGSDDEPYDDATTGDKYIDFVINAKDGDSEESHVYLPVNDLVDTYTSGDGIDISTQNVVSVKIDAVNANGLEKGTDGLKLNPAVANGAEGSGGSAGAMSAADKTKLDGIETATDEEVEQMLDEVFGSED